MKPLILSFIFILLQQGTYAQNLASVQDKLSEVAGKDEFYYMQTGNRFFNEKQFYKAEENYVKALELLHNNIAMKEGD